MKELLLRLKILFCGLPKVEQSKCKRCERLSDKSTYYKQRYIHTKERLQESEELLKLAVDSINLSEQPKLKDRLTNRRFK